MIKLLACIFILVDHIGLVFFPEVLELRIVGRLSMPLFAYAIARGFKSSYNHGTLAGYKMRILVFAVVSQIPYMLMVDKLSFNIGVLWLLCLLFLERAERPMKSVIDYCVMCIILACSAIVPIDYGFYGLGFTLILYYYKVRNDYNIRLLTGYILVHLMKIIQDFEQGIMQIFTFPCLALINLLEKYDNRVRIGRQFFYVFYPLHITVLLIIKRILYQT